MLPDTYLHYRKERATEQNPPGGVSGTYLHYGLEHSEKACRPAENQYRISGRTCLSRKKPYKRDCGSFYHEYPGISGQVHRRVFEKCFP